VARVAGVSRQAPHRRPGRRPAVAGPGAISPDDQVVVEVAKVKCDRRHPHGRRVGHPRAGPASQPQAGAAGRARPAAAPGRHGLGSPWSARFFRVTRPDELWRADTTKAWTAQHGWAMPARDRRLLHREVTGWSLALRCHGRRGDRLRRGRRTRAQHCSPNADARHGQRQPVHLAGFPRHLPARGITHRRGGYRDPEPQAFIESWFGQFTKRLAWRSQWESLDQARRETAGYVDADHHRPHSRLAYRTPAEVAATWWCDPDVPQTRAT
jgi:putative transposase